VGLNDGDDDEEFLLTTLPNPKVRQRCSDVPEGYDAQTFDTATML
jgi:hypothetical protein